MVYVHGGNPKWSDYHVLVDGKVVEDWIAADDSRGIVVAYEWHSDPNGDLDADYLKVLNRKVELVKSRTEGR